MVKKVKEKRKLEKGGFSWKNSAFPEESLRFFAFRWLLFFF